MKMFPRRNFKADVSDDMEDALNWLCARCHAEHVTCITLEEVRAFLRDEEGRPDLADQFTTDLLLPLAGDVR